MTIFCFFISRNWASVTYAAFCRGYRRLRIRPGATGITDPWGLNQWAWLTQVMTGKLTPAAIAYDILQQLHIDCSGLCCALLLPSYLPLEGDSTIRYGIAQNTAGAKYTLEAAWEPSGIGHISRRGEGRADMIFCRRSSV
jgi:hypothetical protein